MAKHDGSMQTHLFGGNITVTYTLQELIGEPTRDHGFIRRVIKGHDRPHPEWGGHQNLAYLIQQREHGGQATFTIPELDKIYWEWVARGNGTYQKAYFLPTVMAARRAGWRPTKQQVADADAHRQSVLDKNDDEWDDE